jgi:hypothetical protein
VLLLVLMGSTLIVAVVAVKKRRRIGALKMKYQRAIHTFANTHLHTRA